jgi:ADP-heptose:LPS heptosyltransferase
MYAACGIADKGFNVTFHTNHVDWLSSVQHPNVRVCQEPDLFADANLNYAGQLKSDQSMSRPNWYIKNLHRFYELPDCVASRPASVAPFNKGQKVAVIAPSSIWAVRSWNANRWTELSNLLRVAGYLVTIVGSGKNQEQIPADRILWNRPASEVLQAIGEATILFGNDSGMAHLAGLLGTPAVVVLGPTTRDFVFDCSDSVVGIASDMPCTGCFWQRDRGWDERCVKICESLQSIQPEAVFQLGESHVNAKQTDWPTGGVRREAAGTRVRSGGRRSAKAKIEEANG